MNRDELTQFIAELEQLAAGPIGSDARLEIDRKLMAARDELRRMDDGEVTYGILPGEHVESSADTPSEVFQSLPIMTDGRIPCPRCGQLSDIRQDAGRVVTWECPDCGMAWDLPATGSDGSS